MQKLFLLDAYALIYRSYYAFIKNPRINSKGLNTSAIIGFCNTLNEVLQKEQPTHIGVAFDPHGPTFRSEAYPEYKAQREETPEDIRKAVPIIKDILKAYRIPILQVDGYEADDVIGTLATKARMCSSSVLVMVVVTRRWVRRKSARNMTFHRQMPSSICWHSWVILPIISQDVLVWVRRRL